MSTTKQSFVVVNLGVGVAGEFLMRQGTLSVGWTDEIEKATKYPSVTSAVSAISSHMLQFKHVIAQSNPPRLTVKRVIETPGSEEIVITRRSRRIDATKPFVLYDKQSDSYAQEGSDYRKTNDLQQARVFGDLGDLLIYLDTQSAQTLGEPQALNVERKVTAPSLSISDL